MPRGTVTFLFTDVEGSTRLLAKLGAEQYAAELQQHRAVLRAAFTRHGGVEVDTQGDAFFVAFPTATGAVAAATDAQSALAAGPISVRMGIHTGEPLVTEQGYVGMEVHRAARIAAAAHGGQVLVSETTRALLAATELRDLGPHRLKDLSAPVRLYQAGEGDFPAPKTLYRTNMPVPATPFLGREREVDEVVELLERDEVRLLTLTGPGGVGKTRLALQAAAELADGYPDGVTWVPLGLLRDPATVVPAIAAARDARVTGQRSALDVVSAELVGKRAMLVLDNFEHLIAAARDVAALVLSAPTVDVLVTSRQPLAVAAEREYPVASLARRDAVDLFIERALAVRPGFRASNAVHELCARLDYLPLAIELAAARTRAMSPEALVERLGRRLDLLKGGRDADPRQQTLRATIGWSYDLLDSAERELFAMLAVFVGGCRLGDAELICHADVDVLAALVEKSLVRRRIGPDGDDRYSMLETIRKFAEERLEEIHDRDEVRTRYAERLTEIAEETFAEILAGGSARGAYERFATEEPNFRAVLASLREQRSDELLGRLCSALFFHWFFRADPREGAGWTNDALAGNVPEPLRAALENELGALMYLSGDAPHEALALARASVERCRRLGDNGGLIFGLTTVGNILSSAALEDEVAAQAAYEEALGLALALYRGGGWWQRALLANLGMLHATSGRSHEALEYLTRARSLALEAGDEVASALDTVHIASIQADLEAWPEARRLLGEGLASVYELGLRPWVLWALLVAARIDASDGLAERGARLLGAAEALYQAVGYGLEEIDTRSQRRAESALRDALGPTAFELARQDGGGLTLEDAVGLAVSAIAGDPEFEPVARDDGG